MPPWSGALLITSTVRPEWIGAFRAWHNLEHLPERMAIPGFVAARRFVDVSREDRFLTLYQVAAPAVLESAPYRALLDRPDARTARILSEAVTGTTRLLCWRQGGFVRGEGGLMAIAARPFSGNEALAPLRQDAAIAAVHALAVDTRMTATPGAAIAAMDVLPDIPAMVTLVERWAGRGEPAGRDCAVPPQGLFQLEASVRATA